MIDMNLLLQKAIALAERAHAGQIDKAGKPYIGHPVRVMNRLATAEQKIVGVLHDAVEDSDLTLPELAEAGFPPELVAAIDAITKREGEDYEVYLNRVMTNPVALAVKIADMTDNLDPSRIATPTEKDVARMKKYQAVLPRLQAAMQSHSSQP
ncbi:MAG: bifunctional (p)ppGpp synthetase/guanosine-3',5'-bis(diphosphate) 3'-pyrophosphohydrolase [Rhizobacter sp.]|nr:bifunctional (p)ppGpp synthetase/guanosine-3',5'-bis(diphosphate) 3'-pyrophosphohydrolase [Chlorobiales bacterium]